ncbi:MAG: ATP-binding protein [Actinomycetota bacterium]
MSRSRVLASVLFVAAIVVLAAAVVLWLRGLGGPSTQFGFRGGVEILTLTFAAVGYLLASRRPANAIGWIFLIAGVASAFQALAQEYATFASTVGDARGVALGAWVDAWIWVPITGAISIYVVGLFPTGHVPSRGWRWVPWVGGIGILVFAAGFAIAPRTDTGIANPVVTIDRGLSDVFAAGGLLYLAAVLGAVASLVVRFRRSRGDERQQLRWFVAAAALIGVFLTITFAAEFLAGGGGHMARVAAIGLLISFAGVPVATGLAVLKYRLYDLDVVISRALLYGGLVAVITLFYVGVVVGIGTIVGRRANLFLSIVATAVIALAFQPLRERVRRFANRVVYGKRATPYEVLSEFTAGIGAVYSAEAVLPQMARLLGEGTGGETGVWIHVGDELRLAASWPEAAPTDPIAAAPSDDLPSFDGWDRAYPVRHRGDLLGALTIRKPPQEPLTSAEEKLVDDVADQAGLILGNVRLIEELRASRQRLVAAQDEERRRLERDIHDGAQQQIVALSVKLRLARTLAGKDAAKAQELLDQLQADNQETLETLRDLARGIYPPLLADRGLAAALEAQARKAPIDVDVHPDGLGRYPKEVEAGAYFCVLEALQNVTKYAEATRVDVELRADDGHLVFEVRDDGKGFDPALTPQGSGLTNMRDRLEALGGSIAIRSAPGQGTTVEGRIPAQPEVAASQASASRSGSNSDFGM